jgi:hypothetical protein
MGPTLWVELLLSAIGLRRIVENDLLVIREKDKAAAKRLPGEMRAGWEAYFSKAAFGKADPLPDGWDWTWLAKRLDDEWQPVEVVGNFSDEELDRIRAACEERRTWVRANAPVRTRQTIVGLKETPTSDVDLADFRRAWHAVDDVMRFALDTWGGIATGKQLETVEATSPAAHALSKDIMFRALAKRLAAKDSYKVPWRKEIAVGTYLGQSSWTAELAASMQAAVEQGEPSQPAMKPLDIDTKALTTPMGRAESR